ncbi:MAG: hypothetical protein JNL74_14975, partial [Fibrobacteres bacterium]|nr:hypothetical protein [Fibrobacterota bacterium]
MLRKPLYSLILVLLISAGSAFAVKITIASTEGTVQVRKEGSREWETLKKGALVEDNDQIQTAFKGRCEISAGPDNTILLGSGSRMLINVTVEDEKNLIIGISLLNGSVYTKLLKAQAFSLYTSSAKLTASEAIFNTTIDEITGITGFHVLRGEITVQNISIQGTQVLKPGETATVSPSTPPSMPRKITTQQMSVLTRFYGSDFVNQELKSSGLELESATSSSRSSVSVEAKALDNKQAGQSSEAARGDNKISIAGNDTKKSGGIALFNKDKTENRVADYIKTKYRMYETPSKQEQLKQYKYRLFINAGAAMYNNKIYPSFDLVQSYYWKNNSVAIHLPVVSNEYGGLSLQINSLRAVLDKIYSVETMFKNAKIQLGAIDNMDMGYELLLRNYSNKAKADNLRNLGVKVSIDGFFDHL